MSTDWTVRTGLTANEVTIEHQQCSPNVQHNYLFHVNNLWGGGGGGGEGEKEREREREREMGWDIVKNMLTRKKVCHIPS